MTIHTLFDSIESMVVSAAEGVRPAERLTVSEAAEKYRKVNVPGAYVGPWLNSTTPYLVEPMDMLTSVSHQGMIFAGPAQCGKTDMCINWITYSAICDPADMMLIEKVQASARDFSIRRVDRLFRHTPEVGERLIQRRNSDNTFDKRFTSGMILTMSWPSINELSGRPIPRLWLSDYDRMEQDVDGEGEPFDLAKKRATTFRSHGMCVAESSPGFVLENPKWIAKSPHEAPPTQGILKLYNRGDRRRWQWKCVECKNAFEPDFSLLKWPKSEDMMEAAEMVTLDCPHCNMSYTHEGGGGLPGKHELNRGGKWIKDGMIWRQDGEIVGKPFRSDLASFWLKGPAATWVNWKELVFKFLTAEKEYLETGTETSLKSTVNTDQGLPYTPKSQSEARMPETLKARARDLGLRVVPHGVRFLVACIDVQKHHFEVQVHGIGVGGDVWIVDRFKVQKSKRLDKDGERYWINPGAYFEDWKLLVEEVMLKTYPLIDGSGRQMAVKMTMCDSGGKEGVTANAYNFVRWLRDGKDMAPDKTGEGMPQDEGDYVWQPGLFPRFQLVKGDPSPTAPRVRLAYPDSQRKDRHAGARGEIPVLFLNSNLLKDQIDNMLDRTEARGGRVSFPDWLPDSFYTELTVETKDPVKGWLNLKNYRNESWDLLAYCNAATLTRQIALEHIDWEKPHSWAENWDKNDLVFNPATQKKPFESTAKPKYDLSSLADKLA
jgi:phage terminase large subunit GpA-like protein